MRAQADVGSGAWGRWCEAVGGRYSRDANDQGEVGACHAHGESIGASHMAEDCLNDSEGFLLERKADAWMAEVQPRQRVAVDTPCMLEAAGACDPRQAGTTSEPPVREADSGHISDGDVERCEVLGWSYVLLSALTGLACLAAMIAGFAMMSGQVPGDGGVMPPGGVALGDCMNVLVSPLSSPLNKRLKQDH